MSIPNVADYSALINPPSFLQPSVFVTCSAKHKPRYRCHGVWIHADQSPEDLHKAIQSVLATCPSPNTESWIIRGFQDFCGILLPTHPDLKTLSEVATFILEYGKAGVAHLRTLYPHLIVNQEMLAKAKDSIENNYRAAFYSTRLNGNLLDLKPMPPPRSLASAAFKIYMTCLASCSKDQYHGVWVDACQSAAALEQAAQAMLDTSPAKNKIRHWIILNAEGFDSLRVDPFTPLETIAEGAAFLTRHGMLGAALIRRLSRTLNRETLLQAQWLMTQGYQGVFNSKRAFIKTELARVNIAFPKKESDYRSIEATWFSLYYFALTLGDAVHVFERKPIPHLGFCIG